MTHDKNIIEATEKTAKQPQQALTAVSVCELHLPVTSQLSPLKMGNMFCTIST